MAISSAGLFLIVFGTGIMLMRRGHRIGLMPGAPSPNGAHQGVARKSGPAMR